MLYVMVRQGYDIRYYKKNCLISGSFFYRAIQFIQNYFINFPL